MHTKVRGCFILLLAVSILPQLSLTLLASDYPERPIKIITQGAPGSGPDIIARLVFNRIAEGWKHQPVIVNAPGAGGTNAARQVAAAAPDGYTLYMASASSLVVMPEIVRNLPFDVGKDFVPIGIVADQPLFIAAASSLGVRSLAELILLTKNNPGQHNYAAGSVGTLPHIVGERFRKESGADLTFIPYSGIAAGLQDLLGGRISVLVEGAGLVGAADSNAISLLATTSKQRLDELPSLPAASETIPGFSATGWFVLMAPAGTPSNIIKKLNRDLNQSLARADLKDQLQKMYSYTRLLSPEETEAFVKSERNIWQPIVRSLNINSR